MNGYTLTWRPGGPTPADGTALRPDALADLHYHALSVVPIRVGRTSLPLADLFDIAGQPGDTLTLRGLPPLPRLGAHMRSRTLIVHSNVGDDLGAGMAGGLIRVHGSAGHRVGGPTYTAARGMSGGQIIIHGPAGDYVGLRMRRGLIYIEGNSGASPGYRMLAGTIVLGRGPSDHPGLEMKRGTIVCLDAASPRPNHPHLIKAGRFEAGTFVAWQLLMRQMTRLNAPVASADGGRIALFSGDRFEGGKGELWQWER